MKARKPKLICRTPWLYQESDGCGGRSWKSKAGVEWFCCGTLGAIYPVVLIAKRIRLSLYDARTTRSLRPKVYFDRCSCGCGITRIQQGQGGCANTLYQAPEKLLCRSLPSSATKSAWLEIELKD